MMKIFVRNLPINVSFHQNYKPSVVTARSTQNNNKSVHKSTKKHGMMRQAQAHRS